MNINMYNIFYINTRYVYDTFILIVNPRRVAPGIQIIIIEILLKYIFSYNIIDSNGYIYVLINYIIYNI